MGRENPTVFNKNLLMDIFLSGGKFGAREVKVRKV